MKTFLKLSIIVLALCAVSCGHSSGNHRDKDYSSRSDNDDYSYGNDNSPSDDIVFCQACGGLGVTSFGMQCPTCGGAGYFTSSGTTNTGNRDANIGQRQKCVSCNGSGLCWRCDGKGWWEDGGGYGQSSSINKCTHCNGTGRCSSCGGAGSVL